MKKSRIAKFALLGASAAALAATLSTSTYAWYVSNKEADVTGGSGTTGTAGADGSIMLSWTNDSNAKWMKELSLSGTGSTMSQDVTLQPVTYVTNAWKTINDLTGAADVASTDVITFDFYVKAGKAGTAQIEFTFANNTQTMPTQLLYKDVAGKTAGTTVSVDILDALGIQQIVDSGTPSYAIPTGYTSKTTSGFAPTSTSNAASYYKAITNITPAVAAPMGTSTSFADLTLAANTPVHLQYTIFLDGGDYSCFNACQGQTFTFNIAYKYTEATPTNPEP